MIARTINFHFFDSHQAVAGRKCFVERCHLHNEKIKARKRITDSLEGNHFHFYESLSFYDFESCSVKARYPQGGPVV